MFSVRQSAVLVAVEIKLSFLLMCLVDVDILLRLNYDNLGDHCDDDMMTITIYYNDDG